MTHISAEQKRRFNIKMGFDTLHSLVTTLKCQSNIKPVSCLTNLLSFFMLLSGARHKQGVGKKSWNSYER